jgi:alkylation response protein AidB-like acyl-CoA dehydrogenase
MVEKISRDVRITRIYEGTSEIMEMTIGRDRWQFHLKTKGQYYHDKACEAEALHATHPKVGADIAALALHALAEVMEKARVNRLTRFQHVLFRMGEWIAYAECAFTLAKRAALFADGKQNEKADARFDATALAAISRIFAREAAMKVALEGLKYIAAGGGVSDEEMPLFEAAVSMTAIHRTQKGMIEDMDYVANVLYNRVKKDTEVKQPVLA